ncbi:atherin-like [Arapaima gigas]
MVTYLHRPGYVALEPIFPPKPMLAFVGHYPHSSLLCHKGNHGNGVPGSHSRAAGIGKRNEDSDEFYLEHNSNNNKGRNGAPSGACCYDDARDDDRCSTDHAPTAPPLQILGARSRTFRQVSHPRRKCHILRRDCGSSEKLPRPPRSTHAYGGASGSRSAGARSGSQQRRRRRRIAGAQLHARIGRQRERAQRQRGTMSDARHRDWILETIDSLRSRKARPDLERICRMVRRRYGWDADRTRAELEKLIQEQTVLRVSYKGSISYRNAAKVQRKSRKKPEPPGEPRAHPAHGGADGDGGDSSGAHGPAHTEDAQELRSLPECTEAARSPDPPQPPQPEPEPETEPNPSPSASPARERRQERHKTGKTRASYEGSTERLSAKCGRRGGAEPIGANLGDRLVASVRSLAVKSRGGAAAARGHAALGLEILGFLSSQERLAQEKLTRSRVKVVLEREVARGRLRRTRFGSITLPVSEGARAVSAGTPRSSARLPKSAQGARHSEKVALKEEEPMETSCANEEMQKPQEEDQNGDHRTSCPVASPSTHMPSPDPAPPTLSHALSVDIGDTPAGPAPSSQPPSSSSSSPSSSYSSSSSSSCAGPKQEGGGMQTCHSTSFPTEGKQPEPQADTAGDAEGEPPQKAESPPTTGAELGVQEGAITTSQPPTDTQDQVMAEPEGKPLNSCVPADSCPDYKVEGGMASCLLTPTASPLEDSAIAKEQRLNGAVMVKMEKSAQNPVEWTVSDVVSYFVAAGFPEQAAAFRTQEIDGKSLLLMQRNDVLTGLSIRLGPALKIYERHVKVLQRTHFQDDSALC